MVFLFSPLSPQFICSQEASRAEEKESCSTCGPTLGVAVGQDRARAKINWVRHGRTSVCVRPLPMNGTWHVEPKVQPEAIRGAVRN